VSRHPIARQTGLSPYLQIVRQSTLLVRTDAPIHDPAWTVGRLSLEDLVLAYMGQSTAHADHWPALEAVR
jgi:ABC-2 type transport system ATP-binding protein